jgi:hypothetical protein
MNSPNNIVIDEIPNWAVILFHAELDRLRDQYGVRVRIKTDGRTSRPLRTLPYLQDITPGDAE